MARTRDMKSFLTVATERFSNVRHLPHMPTGGTLVEQIRHQLSFLKSFPYDELIRGPLGGVELCYVDRQFKSGSMSFSCFPITENVEPIYTSRIKTNSSLIFVPVAPFAVMFRDPMEKEEFQEENKIPHLHNEVIFKDTKSYFLISSERICDIWHTIRNEEIAPDIKNYQELGLLLKSYEEMLTAVN